MRKMYNQPTTDILSVKTTELMQGAVISINSGTDPNPTAGAPSRKGLPID